jgi:hypothetical protein
MPPPRDRYVKLSALTAVLWAIYLVPWPVPDAITIALPTILAATFALLAHRLGLATWGLVLTFSATFFLHSVVAMYFGTAPPAGNLAATDSEMRLGMTYLGALLFSPFTLWGPVVGSCLAYAAARRARSNKSWSVP